MATNRSAEKKIREDKSTVSRSRHIESRTLSRSAKTGEFIHIKEGRGKATGTKKSTAGRAIVRGHTTVTETIVVRPARKVKATAAVKANYPHPTSSPDFTRLLVQCFVDARNAAIDELKAETASGS